MKTDFIVQEPCPSQDRSFAGTIQQIAAEQEWARMSVAVAYSSVAGITRVHDLVSSANQDICFRWLLGVDDYFTQPGAIEFCALKSKESVRIYKSSKKTLRFHPKIYLFEGSAQNGRAALIVGSTNLTASAMERNCEAYAIIRTAKRARRNELVSLYESLWNLGISPSEKFMMKYKRNYRRQANKRSFPNGDETVRRRGSKPQVVLKSDQAETSPEAAKVCWIEVGKNTAMGRELEFKAEQARYFGLKPRGGIPEHKIFLVSSGTKVKLRLKYQANKMWRLQFTPGVPEFANGLRPRARDGTLGRSPYVARFRRIEGNKEFKLDFIRVDSRTDRKIRARSISNGTLGRTTAREYGWY